MSSTPSFAGSVPSSKKLASRSARTGGIKAAVLAVLLCMGGIVGGGLYFKAKETGQDPLAIVKEKLDDLAPRTALAAVDPAKEPAEPEEKPAKPEPKTPAKKNTDKAAKEPTASDPPAKEPAKKESAPEGGDLPGKTEPKAEPKTPAKTEPKTKTEPGKNDPGKGEDYPAEQKNILGEIRKAMSDRQIPFAKDKLKEAAKMDGSEGFKAEVARLDTIHDYLVQFWKGVDEGGKRVHQLDELTIGSTTCSVVEYANETLVLRIDGVNKRYHMSTMSQKVSLTLAAKALKTDAAVNKVIVGAFLAMDAKGDKDIARKYWEEGKKAGIDTTALMPELGIVGPKQLNVPQNLTPAMKAQLTLANWMARREKNGKYQKGPIPPIGRTVTPYGWLGLIYDTTQTEAFQAVNRRRITGDFTFRMILDDVKEGQQCGVFAADDKDKGGAHYVNLPLGTVHIEFSRKGDKFECNLNGEMVEVQHTEGAPMNMAGMAGLGLLPGSNCAIAYFEFLK